MQPISYVRHQFPPEIIRQAVWLYQRFTLSDRHVQKGWLSGTLTFLTRQAGGGCCI
jgi:transposase-like protein